MRDADASCLICVQILETPVTRSPRTSFSDTQGKPRMDRRASDTSDRSTISDS